jgi:hypothetical protein
MANQDKLKAFIERIIFTPPMVTAAALSVMVPMITFVLEHPLYNPLNLRFIAQSTGALSTRVVRKSMHPFSASG